MPEKPRRGGLRPPITIKSKREGDGRWIAEVLELPEVVVYADTETEARAKAVDDALEVHSAQQQVALWAHTELLMTTGVQRPERGPDLLTEFRNVKRFVEMFFDNPIKPSHDRRVMPLRRSILPTLAVAEASRHRFDQCLSRAASG